MEKEFVESLPADLREFIDHFGYLDFRLGKYILASDNARYINHSDNPNIKSDETSNKYGIDIAIRDIQPGEEITIDYNTIEK